MAGKGGGAWKVAYADFVTAMMAFFMVMWLTSQSNAVKQSIAVYFRDPNGLEDSDGNPMSTKMPKSGRYAAGGKGDKGQASMSGVSGKGRLVKSIQEGKRIVIGGPIQFRPNDDQPDEVNKANVLKVGEMVRGKYHIVEVRGYYVPFELGPKDDDGRPTNPDDPLKLAWRRVQNVADLLGKDGGVSSELIRLSVAAPVEINALVRANPAAEAFERVDIATFEAKTVDYTGPQ